MKKNIIRVVALVLAALLVSLMVPVFTPVVLGEERPYDPSVLPKYDPVTLPMAEIEPIDYKAPTPYAPHESAYLPDNGGYIDDSISIRIEKFRVYDTDCLATWVQIVSPTQMRTALAAPYPSKRVARVAEMGKMNKGIIAINGDYFCYHDFGYVVKNGKVLRKHYSTDYDTLLIDDKGDFTIIQETTKDKVDAVGGNIVQTFTFGPALVIDGEIKEPREYPSRLCGGHKQTQRMVLCQMDTLSYLIVCTEGPENEGSTGLTLTEISRVVHDMGAKQAYNLDGGSSSTLAMKNKKINSVSSNKIRTVGDILYFVTGYEGE